MGRTIDYEKAIKLLNEEFTKTEKKRYSSNQPPKVSKKAQNAAQILFNTQVQSYREALLGCALARVLDPEINVRSPYAKQGERAFSGRSLDEKVIHPFLLDKQIPCGHAGPYLSAFRRNVCFVEETAGGLKDQKAYKALLDYLEELEQAKPSKARKLLRYLLYCFIELRERSEITLTKIPSISLTQLEKLIDKLLSQPSGGLFPVLLVVALLKTVKEVYQLNWEVEWQKINVADQPRGIGGDVTIKENNQTRTVFEVTERTIDRSRVQAVFQSKISPSELKDYLFVFVKATPESEARTLAEQLFAQGYEVGFVPVRYWVICNLATAGRSGRETFLKKLFELLEEAPARMKMFWNEQLRSFL